MRRARFNMGRVDWIGAESVGVPGQRTFRVMALTESTSAQMWLEKEQLQRLAEAIARMFLEIDTDKEMAYSPTISSVEGSNPKPPNFPGSPEVEFKVGALGLRYDPQQELIALEAFDIEAAEGAAPELQCLTTREQMEKLQSDSLDAISGGRPLCPLCHTPLPEAGLPHFCPPTNGHQKLGPDD